MDVSGLSQLEQLYCGDNRLTELVLEGLTSLTDLSCDNNNLTEIDVIGLAELRGLDCSANNLTELYVENLSNLDVLYYGENEITEIDLSGLTNLTRLNSAKNNLTEIHVSELTGLVSLDCSHNNLTELMLGELPGLKYLYCEGNDLAEIDLSGVSGLVSISCGENNLTAIDVSALTGLEDLYCVDNQLTELDVRGLSALQTLYCAGNPLESLKITDGISYQLNMVEGLSVDLVDFLIDSHQVILRVTPQTSFGHWVRGSDDTNVITDNPYTFTIDRNIELTAVLGFCSEEDVAVINAIIEDNGLEATTDSPESWDFVTWSQGVTKRVVELNIVEENLFGCLDVSGLKELTTLFCNNNDLTGLDISGLSKLQLLSCIENPIESLKISEQKSYKVNMIDGFSINLGGFSYSDTPEASLEAIPDEGNDFMLWMITSDGTNINSVNNPYTFIIDGNIELTPCSTNVPSKPVITATAGNAQVTINWTVGENGGSEITGYKLTVTAGGNAISGSPISIAANATSYTVTGLTNGTTYNFSLVAINANGGSIVSDSIAATPYASGGSSDNNTNRGGGTSTPVQPLQPKIEVSTGNNSATVSAEIKPTVSGSTASATVSAATVTEVVKAATDAAKNNGTEVNVEFKVTAPSGATTVETIIPKTAVSELAKIIDNVVITTPIANIKFNDKALAQIANTSGGDVKITANVNATLPAATQLLVGNKPVYDFTVKVGNTEVSDFGNGKATIAIPYTLASGEKANCVVVYYINAKGEHEIVKNCKYDEVTKTVSFITTHFSRYAVSHKDISFNDVANEWFAGAVDFVAARELFAGVSGGNFDPSGTMTRAMFVTVLARLDGADLSRYVQSTFTDVDISDWYGKAVMWSADKGITGGVGNNQFAPSKAITREEMAVMLSKYIKYKDIKLPETGNNTQFSDINKVSAWAVDAVADMKRFGIAGGDGGNNYAPQDTANRASVATIFMNFIHAMLK